MRNISCIACCATLSLMSAMSLHAADAPPPATKLDDAVIGPFVKTHCTRCHGAAKQTADVRFDTLSLVITNSDQAQRWQDVLDVLNGGNMPPKEEKQPTSAALEKVIGELTEKLFEARKRLAASGGSVAMRRLNRREYAATIRHLFGFEPPAERIPPNDDVVNFDTVGSRQFFTAAHFDEYYAIAQEVLREGFKWAGVREPVQTRVQEPEEFWNAVYRRDLEKWKGQKEGKVVRLSKLRETYLARPKVESGVYLDEALRHLTFGHAVDPRGSYRILVKAGIEGEVAPFRRFIRLNLGEDVLAVLRIDGTPDKPTESVVEIQRPALLGRRLGGSVAEARNGAWLSHYLASINRHEGIDPKGEGLIWIDSFSVDGPFYPDERSFFDSLLCPEPPTPGKRSAMVWHDKNARELIERFTFEAFHTLIDQNLPVSNLIKSDFVTVNAQLAVHYGIPGVTTNEFKPVKVPVDSPRGGYLTQAAFLVAGSNGERTSPAVRGMLLMSRFLNSPPAPPPPNVPELGSGVEGPKSNRQLVELHQTRAQCASCHRKMDTIGLALENFDLLGRYRETEKVGRDKQPVRISGAMPGGKAFSSFPQFRSTLLEHEEDLARNMVESLLVYALGRDIEFTDAPEIEKMMVKLRPNHFRMKDMIHAVAESPLFVRN